MGKFFKCLYKEENNTQNPTANPKENTTRQAGRWETKRKLKESKDQKCKMPKKKNMENPRKKSETEMEDKPLTNGTNQEHREHMREPGNRCGRCRIKTDELTNSEGRRQI